MKQQAAIPVSSRPALLASPAGKVSWISAFAGFALGTVLASFAWVAVLPDEQNTSTQGQGDLVYLGPGQGAGEAAANAGQGSKTTSAGTKGAGAKTGPGGLSLGGGTKGGGPGSASGDDSSVTDKLIKLGATYVDKSSGIGGFFLGEVKLGMDAVVARVNAQGGIHGRQLQVIYREDGWDASRGQTFIQNLIVEKKVFALAVSPSSEGLNAAANADVFEAHGVPVVGADGLNNSQFVKLTTGAPNPWIWPVAAATTTQAHVIMHQACKDIGGAGCAGLSPGIVFGNTYKFGVEGSFAFNGAYCRARGGEVKSDGYCNDPAKDIPGFTPGGTSCEKDSRFCGINSNLGQFPSETDIFNRACNTTPRCNFVLLLLEPKTALDWMKGPFTSPGNLAGAQPLFTSYFATQCGIKCNGMQVWTGYNPPVGAYANNPAVAEFVRALKNQSPNADEFNQFTIGGYVGMSLLAEALQQVGKDLNRDKLVEKLNSMTPLNTGLTNSEGLKWTASSRYANHSAQAFRIDYVTSFQGFQPVNPYIRDPWLGKDNRLP